ncbi:MAG: TMEM43 family protein [Candidatus Moranbacteria bacterium]|nr:TMEM43 family protein [Candidatus Moranbacteria bacterium]
MVDQYVETTTKSWGSRILSSITGVFIGILIFFASFYVLFWNEGRTDLSEIAKKSVEISSKSLTNSENDNELISVTGTLQSNEKIGDDFIKKGDYISLNRNVEMYAWVEKKSSKSKKNLGGSETTETTYTYAQEWTSSPQNSSNFKIQEEHENPLMSTGGDSRSVQGANVGIYNLSFNQINLPKGTPLLLNNSNTILNGNDFSLANSNYLFSGKGTLAQPQVGDVKISYSAISNPLNTATVFGKLNLKNKQIVPYYSQKNNKIYRVFEGNKEGAIIKMKNEYKTALWIVRAVGFIMMWLGLMMLFGPISVLLDVLPILGSISRGGFSIVSFLVSLILSVITIVVSIVLHSLIALAIIVFSTLVIFIILYLLKSKK